MVLRLHLHPREVGRMTLADFRMCMGLVTALEEGGGGG